MLLLASKLLRGARQQAPGLPTQLHTTVQTSMPADMSHFGESAGFCNSLLRTWPSQQQRVCSEEPGNPTVLMEMLQRWPCKTIWQLLGMGGSTKLHPARSRSSPPCAQGWRFFPPFPFLPDSFLPLLFQPQRCWTRCQTRGAFAVPKRRTQALSAEDALDEGLQIWFRDLHSHCWLQCFSALQEWLKKEIVAANQK